jgi:hypothetical protein
VDYRMSVTPERLAHNGTEDNHQAAFFCWAAMPEIQQQFPEFKWSLFAIPNGGERNKIVAAKMKATGTKAGVLDIFLAVPRKGFHGLFIELKKFGGRPSKEQLEFIEAVRQQGFAACVVEGWEAARNAAIAYMT